MVLYCEWPGCGASGGDDTILRWPSGDEPYYCAPHFAQIMSRHEVVGDGGLYPYQWAKCAELVREAFRTGWPTLDPEAFLTGKESL